ncbi:hypothetical protein, partial [Rhodococcus opacus]|uniref:hypothetical protein n=1 Tax=Rhodococcus opacus TaxID=37919 RepID=UPI003AF53F82
LTDKRIQLFPDPVESGCIHARMLSRRPRKLEPTRRANKVLLAALLAIHADATDRAEAMAEVQVRAALHP